MAVAHSELISHLAQQLGFVERSCKAYDDGFPEEAIRIAVSLRVLFHFRGKSHCLMQLLENNDANLLTTLPVADPKEFSARSDFTNVRMKFGAYPDSVIFVPKLGSMPERHRLINWRDWWDERCSRGHGITRSELVLGAANKDGGAHVDFSGSPKYRAHKNSGVTATRMEPDGSVTVIEVSASHLADIRQLGYEVLTSPDLFGIQ